MEDGDDWVALDKLYHILFCFFLTLLFSLFATLTRYPFIRRRSISVGSILSLLAGAAKEAADELGYFKPRRPSQWFDQPIGCNGYVVIPSFLYELKLLLFTENHKSREREGKERKARNK